MLRLGIPSGFEVGTCTASFGTVPECRTFCALLRLLGCNSVDFGSVADIGSFDDIDGFGPAEVKFSESFPQDKDSDNGSNGTHQIMQEIIYHLLFYSRVGHTVRLNICLGAFTICELGFIWGICNTVVSTLGVVLDVED